MPTDDGPGLRRLLAAAASEDEAEETDPRWRALAEGRLSPEEIESLRDEAEQSDEGRLLWEMYRPFDEEEQQRVLDAVRARVREEKARS